MARSAQIEPKIPSLRSGQALRRCAAQDDNLTPRVRALAVLAAAELLAMALWFGVSAVAPRIAGEWGLSSSTSAWLTLAVQLGFVAGTLLSALLNLPDVFSARYVLMVCIFLGAIANAILALFVSDAFVAITLRFLTGLFLAGVYPPGMKIAASWFRQDRGLALGILVGALTFGKAAPYLINAVGSENWRINVLAASVLAVLAGALVLFVREGPFVAGRAPFDIRQTTAVFRNRGVRLANFGYFGHMWELYAMWTWAPIIIREGVAARNGSPVLAEAGSFLMIGSGAAGCIVAGRLADRMGRTLVTSWAMVISGACCLVIGFVYDVSIIVLLLIAAIWGATVVADSAQFSACVTELSDQRYVGTALTLQLCVGFLITMLSIKLIPPLVETVGWRYAFIALAPGPIFGVISMLRLRQLPEAAKIAQGKR